jgi:hypothetical protein
MKILLRFAGLLLLTTFLLGIPAAASGAELVAFTEAETEEAEPAEENTSGVTPAVEAPGGAAEDEEQPWTTRFLAPGLLVIGIIAVVLVVVYYGVRMRGRYEIVDDAP